MTKFSKNSKRLLGAAAACALLVGWSVSSQAQTCTVGNWDTANNLVDGADNSSGDVGTPPDFRRYAGPCALKVPFGATAAWVENTETETGILLNEPNYIARFYVYLNDLEGSNIPIFEAYDSANAALFAVFFTSDSGTGVIGFDTNGDGSTEFSGAAQSGWNSIEVVYDGVAPTLLGSINGDDASAVASSSGSVAAVRLGNIDGDGSWSGTADFDDFDSRRSSRPGRLLPGDAAGTGAIGSSDLVATRNEILGSAFAAGQPDCNEDGSIGSADLVCIRNILLGN